MRKTLFAACATMACCGIASLARSQDLPRVEVAGGYGLAVVRHEFDWKDYQGWAIQEGTFVRPRLALPVSVDAVYWNWTAPNIRTVGEQHRRYGFLAGVRASGSPGRSVIPFVQVLAGVARASYRLYGLESSDVVGSGSVFTIQPGVGVDVRVSRALAIRASIDARVGRPRFALSWQYPDWRIGAGLVYRFTR